MTLVERGVTAIGFDREAEYFERAVRSAIAHVQKAGCHVAWVKIEPEDLAGAAPASETATGGKSGSGYDPAASGCGENAWL